jgi:hypothetical protein
MAGGSMSHFFGDPCAIKLSRSTNYYMDRDRWTLTPVAAAVAPRLSAVSPCIFRKVIGMTWREDSTLKLCTNLCIESDKIIVLQTDVTDLVIMFMTLLLNRPRHTTHMTVAITWETVHVHIRPWVSYNVRTRAL